MASPDVPNQHVDLARQFTDEMYEGYRYLARTINYRAKQFLEMVTTHGGVGAAQRLLRGLDASDGFTRLWEEHQLDHSVEAAVLHPSTATYSPIRSAVSPGDVLRRTGLTLINFLLARHNSK